MSTPAQLKILDAIVGLVIVDVMNRLLSRQRSAKMLGHHEAVLKDVADFGPHLRGKPVIRGHPH